LKLIHLLPLAFPLFAAGCASTLNTAGSSDFACPGMPGITCKTPVQVYQMTNQDKLASPLPSSPSSDNATPMQIVAVSEGTGLSTPKPIRVPATIMRIWIAPWTDKNDDLHWPSYLFTEVQARRWNFGKPEFTDMQPVVPHRMMRAAAPKGVRQDAAQAVTATDPGSLPQPDEIKLD